jgi:hypothetical protein
LRNLDDWRQVEAGTEDPTGTDPFECREQGRFIRNLRDLANWVHLDYLFQHFLNASLIMLNEPPLERDDRMKRGQAPLDAFDSSREGMQPLFPLDSKLPYSPGRPDAVNQMGFVTFGPVHILTLLAEVTRRALQAAWFQKWLVHRRNRPEEFGGLVHFQKTGGDNPYPCIDPLILNAPVLELIKRRNALTDTFGDGGTVPGSESYLLPQVFPEGSPTHPAYPSGHAVAAGACATILKAFFDENSPMTDPTNDVQTDPTRRPAAFIANDDGSALVKAPGQDGDNAYVLTVGGEINKLASNIAIGRDAAGVHWRSDATEGMKLGEAVAAGLLLENAFEVKELFSMQFTTFFSNETVRIRRERRGNSFYVVWGVTPNGPQALGELGGEEKAGDVEEEVS